MAGVCTVCTHDARHVIDRLLAGGRESTRSIAKQFGLSAASVLRHSNRHVEVAVAREAKKRMEREAATTESIWVERLEQTYHSARQGVERAEADPDNWYQGARFLSVAAKIVETGLKADGIIDGGREMVSINADQVVILPLPPQRAPKPEIVPEIEGDVHSLTLLEDGTYAQSDEES